MKSPNVGRTYLFKTMKKTFILSVLLAMSWIWTPPTSAQTLEDARAIYEERASTIEAERKDKQSTLLAKYKLALVQMRQEAQVAGELEALLMIDEVAAYSMEESLIPLHLDVSASGRLSEIHRMLTPILKDIDNIASEKQATLDQSWKAALEQQIRLRTQAGELEVAIEMREELRALTQADPSATQDELRADQKEDREVARPNVEWTTDQVHSILAKSNPNYKKANIRDENGWIRLKVALKGTTTLKGLEGLPIMAVEARRSELSDMDSIKGLPLRYLNLSGLTVPNLDFLGKMTRLENLILPQVEDGDLSVIKDLPLTWLTLPSTNEPRDLSLVASIPTLTSLTLDGPIANPADLARMDLSKLVWVRSGGTELELRAVAANRNLKELSFVAGKDLIDLRPLASLQLSSLSISAKSFSDLSPFARMQLKSLDLSMTAVTDLSPVRGQPIERLRLNNCKAIDNASLPLLLSFDLESIGLRGTGITQTQVFEDRGTRVN